jgi:CheY-like chemotaxis protein
LVETKKYVLVVDDDPDIRDVIVLTLSLSNFIVQVAESREVALQMIERSEPAVILLDWYMPGMPLEKFVRNIRKKNPAIELVLLSAAHQTRSKAMELCIVHVLDKPFDPAHLIEIVARLSGSPKHQ